MHFFTSTLLLAPLSSLAVAFPTYQPWSDNGQCLPLQTATDLVTGFGKLMSAYSNASAEALLAPDFSDTSDSVNWLAGFPLGGPTFPTKLAFELGAGSQPPVDFVILSIDAVTCTTIGFRWLINLAPGLPAVKGINILYTENNAGVWQIKTVYAEFNSGLWQQELCQIGAATGTACDLTNFSPGPPPSS